eukprot:comp16651_c0_seq1/m.14849 comp16651_c0_seq1/g.14849  ORF comp16651_c0_seq1/g.14849 comp16651_c0_seq1/m.14849 type:complete len:554 (-) comp16651_c0_seq1:203-1864(-)
MDFEEDERSPQEVDYYSLLNLSKQATVDDIKASYRRLCVMYHPDKHQNQEDRDAATVMFNKIQRAYEVLSDEKLRAIYDIHGQKGLDAGLEIVLRTSSPSEIREEYERLKRQREEDSLQRRTNQKAVVNVNINGTALFEPENRRDPNPLKNLEVSGMNMQQSVMAPIGSNNTLTFHGALATSNGNGGGNLSVAARRDIDSRTWVEADVGAGDGQVYYGTVKGFRSLDPHTFATLAGTAQGRFGMHPRFGTTAVIGRRLEPRTMGYLTWKWGLENNMNTSVVRSTESSSLALALQIGQPALIACTCAYKVNDDLKLKGVAQVGTSGMTVEYGADRKISRYNKFGMWVAIGIPSGVVVKVKFSRANQTFLFPIQIAETATSSPVLWGSFVPIGIFWAVTNLIIEPYRKMEQKRKLERLREENAVMLAERRREAEAAQRLMRDSVEKRVQAEEDKKGLVIVRAWYGNLSAGTPCAGEDEGLGPRVIDVTIPLQALVKDSQLHLQEHSKSGLPGFYDCAIGEDKSLRVQYCFRDRLHEVTIADDEPLSCPKRSHAVS